MKLLILLISLTLIGCSTVRQVENTEEVEINPSTTTETHTIDLTGATKYRGRFTVYASAAVDSDPDGKYCLQDKNNRCISAPLNYDKVCFLQMQGGGTVDNVKYSWGGTNRRSKHSCSKWGRTYAKTVITRFKRNEVSHSIGSFNNILSPFKSVACPREFSNKTRIYVPVANGIKLPDNSVHDGVFVCDDRGGAIKRLSDGTYKIDTFIGLINFKPWKMNDWGLTTRKSPFKHTGNTKVTHDFYVLKK